MAIANLVIRIAADIADFEKKIGGVERSLRTTGRNLQSVGSSLTAGLTLPLAAIGGGAIKAAITFESAFANVGKTVDGVSDKAGKLTKTGEALAMTFRNMAKEIPATTSELSAIAALGGQMGVPINQLAHFTKNIAALGVAVDGISTEEAASGLAAIGNATGTGTTQIAEMASALVHLGNNSNATEGDILEFTKRLIGAGHSVGMTVQDVMALGTAMANVGINAEAGGTAMSTVIGKISKAVSTGGEDLNQFAKVAGKSAEEFAAVWKQSPVQAMDLFVRGLGTMRDRGVDLNLTMGELGTEGVRVASTLKLLAGAGDGVGKSITLANEGFTAGNKHLEEAGKKYGTTANQLKLLRNQITDVGITLGTAMLPAIQTAVGVFKSLIPVIEIVAKAFAAMPSSLQTVIVVIGLAAAAFGPLLYVMGQVVLSTSAIIGAFGKKGVATKALAGDLLSLDKTSGTLQGSLGKLGRAAGIAGAAFVGWQIGRLISDLTGLDQKIANTISGLNNFEEARRRAAQGTPSGQAGNTEVDVAQRLAALEERRKAAIIGLNFVNAVLIANQIEALKNDHARLAITDTITAAIKRGAAATITYAEAVKFNAEWDKKRTDGLVVQAAAQQAAGRATETAAQKIDRLAQAQGAISAANKLYVQELTGIKDALRLQITSMDITGKSVKDLATEYTISEQTVSRFKAEIAASGKVAGVSAKALDAIADALQNLRARISGIDLVAKIIPWGKALQDVGAAGKVLADEGLRRELKTALDELERKFGTLEAAGVGSFAGIHKAMKDMVTFAETIPPAIIPQLGATTVANLGEPQMINPIVPTISVDTESSILVAEQAASTFASSYGQKLKDKLAESLESLPQLIINALKVDDALSVAAKVGIAIGQSIGQSIGGPIGLALSDAITALLTNTNVQQAVENLGIELGASLGAAIGGAVGGPLGASLGKILGGIAGSFIDDIFKLSQKETNNRRDEFLATFGAGGTGVGSGFRALADQLHELGAAGDAMFQRLIRADDMADFTAAMKAVQDALRDTAAATDDVADAGFQTQAQLQAVADKALRVYDQMRDSGLYTAATLEAAWERYQTAQEAALGVSPKALEALKALDAELKTLFQSIENEAPEEVMGVIEANTRARIAAVQKERDAAAAAMEVTANASQDAAKDLADAMTLAAQRIEDAFAGIYRDRPPIEIPVNQPTIPRSAPVTRAGAPSAATDAAIETQRLFDTLNLNRFTESFGQLRQPAIDAAREVVEVLSGVGTETQRTLDTLNVDTLTAETTDALSGIGTTTAEMFGTTLPTSLQTFSAAATATAGAVADAFGGVGTEAAEVFSVTLPASLQTFSAAATTTASEVTDAFADVVTKTTNTFSTTLPTSLLTFSGVATTTARNVTDALAGVGTNTQRTLNTLNLDTLTGSFDGLAPSAREAAADVTTTLAGATIHTQRVFDTLHLDKFIASFGDVAQPATAAMTEVERECQRIFDQLNLQRFAESFSDVKQPATAAMTAAALECQRIFDRLNLQKFEDSFGDLKQPALEAASDIEQALKDIDVPALEIPVSLDLPEGMTASMLDPRFRNLFQSDVPQLASGGIVRRPTLAIIGEKGPEAVVPLSDTGLRSAGVSGGSVVFERGAIVIQGDVTKQNAEWLVSEFSKEVRRGGKSRTLARESLGLG